MISRFDAWAVPVFAVVWLTHVVLTLMGDPLGLTFDIALWISSSVLRVAAWIALVRLLAQTHAVIAADWPRALRVLAIWTTAATVLVLAMSATREWWAPRSSSDSSAYYWVSGARHAFEAGVRHRAEWLRAWKAGYVTAAELALAYMLCAVQVAIGFYEGKRPRRSVPLGIATTVMLLVAYLAWCPWFHSDYDFFHGELFAGALVLDAISPMASDPYTTIATFCYLAAWTAMLVSIADPLGRPRAVHA